MEAFKNDISIYTEQLQAGEVRGFNYFFELHYPALCYFARGIINDEALAEEIADDAFVKLWERRESFGHAAAIKAFLYRTVKNAAIDIMRRSKVLSLHQKEYHYSAEREEKNIEQHIIRAETLSQIYSSLSILPPKCRQVFTLFFVDGKSYEEIAQELKLSINNVRNHKARALSLLRGSMGSSLLLTGIILLAEQVGGLY